MVTGQDPPEAEITERIRMCRVLDANMNRAGEGLRVVEDYARFVLDDAHLTNQWKQIRHELRAVMQDVEADELLTARDVLSDVGVRIETEDEYKRHNLTAIAEASQKRVEQSLRCLEEYMKPSWPELARTLEQLRYRTYTIGRAMHVTRHANEQLADLRLYALLGSDSADEACVSLCQRLIAAGVRLFQMRDKRLDDRNLLERARQLREITRAAGALLVINDRPDIARLANADGVHLGQEDMPLKDARSLLGTKSLIGISTHSMGQARQAVLDGADYIGCGPTFASPTKEFSDFPGIDFLKQVSAEIRLPSFAIGGIGLQNVSSVREAGFSRIAVSSSISRADDLTGTVSALTAALGPPNPSR